MEAARGVTGPRGFSAAAVACGIGTDGSRLDLALLATELPVSAAAVFASIPVPAAPVVVSGQHLAASGGVAQCVVMHGGAANAGTGSEGVTIAMLIAAEAASGIGCTAEHVLIAGTGIPGVALPLDRVSAGIRLAAGMMSASGGAAAAQVIAAPDCAGHGHLLAVQTRRGTVVVGGIGSCCCAAKTPVSESGTLAVLTTDAWVASSVLQHALELLVREESNGAAAFAGASISNTMIALASGASGVAIDDEESYLTLVEGFAAVRRQLATPFVRDISLNTPS